MDLRKGWNFAIMFNFQIETALFKDGVSQNFKNSKIKIYWLNFNNFADIIKKQNPASLWEMGVAPNAFEVPIDKNKLIENKKTFSSQPPSSK